MRSINLIALFCFVNFFFFSKINAQEKKELLITYDSIIGKENLLITNGLFHANNYRINNHRNIYFYDENFTIGSINYLGENYFNLKLKYDSFNDDLVYRPTGNSEKSGIILIKNNIESFEIHGSRFVNLNNFRSEKNKLIEGFYEEKIKRNLFTFYVKHYKSTKEIFVNKSVLHEFYDEKYFIIHKGDDFYKISSKNSIIKLFPDQKKYINQFFKDNDDLKKSNKVLFFTNLFQNISK